MGRMRRLVSSLSPAQLQAIYQAIPCGVLVQSITGEVLHVNTAAETILGRSAAELLGRSTIAIADFYDENGEAVPLEERPGYRAVRTGAPVHGVPLSILRPDGERRWLQVDITPLHGPDGGVEQIVASMVDITERRITEERLRGSEERFRSLVQNASDIIMVIGPTGDMRYISPSMERVLGYLPGEIGGMSSFARMHPDDATRLREELISGGLQPGLNAPTEIRIRHRDGSWRWFESVANNLMHDPSVRGIVINSRDITDRRRADDAQRLLADAGALLTASQDERAALDALVRLAVPLFADWCVVDLVDEEGELRRVARTHVDPERLPALLEMEQRYVQSGSAAQGLMRMIGSGGTALLAPMPEEVLAEYAPDPGHRALLRQLGIGAVISTPLRSRGKPLGAITFVVGDSERTYSEADVRTAESLAGRIAMALDNIRLLTAERRAREAAERAAGRTARLQTITAALSEAVTPAQVSDAVLHGGLPAVGASAGAIVLLGSDGVEVTGFRGYSEAAVEEWRRLPADAQAPIWSAMHAGTPLSIESEEVLRRDFPQLRAFARVSGYKSGASVPLLVDGRVIGAMGISFETERPLDDDDHAFLHAMAQQCAQALERARLYQAEHDARAAGQAAEQRLRFLSEATVALSVSLDFEATLAAIVDLVVPLLADWCAVDVLESPGVIRRLAVRTADPGKEPVTRALQEQYPLAWGADAGVANVIRTGRPELYEGGLEPLYRETIGSAEHRALIDELELISCMIVPLIARGETAGALTFGVGESGRSYSTEDLALAEELARRAALAMENARLYQELNERKAQLQELLGRVLAAHEEERRRVAYEIHDGLAQIAVGAHQHLQAFAGRYQPRRPQARVELSRALELTQTTVREARRVIAGLRPTALDDFGLAVALRIECDTLRAEGWDVTYQESLHGRRLPATVETALFRVAQEAMTNVRKHAQTRRLRVSVEPQGMSVRLDVRDWGRGFRHSEEPAPGTPGERVGLAGMRERITLLGGRFRVHSWPGRGSHVIAEVPLKPAEEREERGIAPEQEAEGAIVHGD